MPLLAILGIASVTLMLTQLERDAILLGLSLCALGLGAARVESRRRAALGTGVAHRREGVQCFALCRV